MKSISVTCFIILFNTTFIQFNTVYAQVELSAVAGPVKSNSILNYLSDTLNGPKINPGLNLGFAFATEMSVPLQNRFSLKAGIRLVYKTISATQEFQLPRVGFRNHWHQYIYSLETPVQVTYLAVDRRWQVLIGAGFTASKNWDNVTLIKNEFSLNTVSTNNTISVDYNSNLTGKNKLTLAGECSIEIIPGFFSNYSLCFLLHQDFMKQFSRITYNNKIYDHTSQPAYNLTGSFEVSQPAYLTVQLRYTFRKKQDNRSEPNNNKDFDVNEPVN